MKVWIVIYECLPESDGDYEIDSVWTTEEAARERAAAIPGPRSWKSVYSLFVNERGVGRAEVIVPDSSQGPIQIETDPYA